MTWDTSGDDLVLNDARLYINQDDNDVGIYIDSEASSSAGIDIFAKYGIRSTQDVSSGYAGKFTRNIAEAGADPCVFIHDNHANNTQPALKIQQDGAGYGISIDQNGNKPAIYIDSECSTQPTFEIATPTNTTGHVMQLNDADSLTTAGILYMASNSSTTDSRNLVTIINDHASATGAKCLSIQQDANQEAFKISHSGTTNRAMQIDASSLTTGDGLMVYSNASNTSTRNLVNIINDHASATGTTGLKIQQDSTGLALNCDGGATFNESSADVDFRVESNGNAGMFFIDGGNNRVGIGTSSPDSTLNISEDGQPIVNIDSYSNTDGDQAYVNIRKAAGTEASPGNVVDDENLGGLTFRGYHTDGHDPAAGIYGFVDGTPGNGDMPGRLSFLTTADGSNSPTERMRIDSSGNVGIGTSSSDEKLLVSGPIVASGALQNHKTSSIVIDQTNSTTSAITAYGADASTAGTLKFIMMANDGNPVNNAMLLDANSRVSLSNNDSGTSNTVFGKLAGEDLASGGNYNVFIGEDAGKNVTTGDGTVAVGFGALFTEILGNETTAIGTGALYSQVRGSSATTGNVGVGRQAGYYNVTGTNNTYVGYRSGFGADSQSNSNNTAVGKDALLAVTDGSDNVAIGNGALDAITSGGRNIGIGSTAGSAMTNNSCLLYTSDAADE